MFLSLAIYNLTQSLETIILHISLSSKANLDPGRMGEKVRMIVFWGMLFLWYLYRKSELSVVN